MQVDRTIDRFVLDLSIRNGLSCRGAYLDQEKDYLSGSTKATYQNKAYLSKNDPNLHNTPKDAIVFDAAVNAVVAPCFARGKYRQILNEAKYYQAIESIYDDFTAAVERSAAQDTVYVQQIKHQDTIMLFVLQLGSCSGSDIPQGGRRGGNCGGTCAHGGHDVGCCLGARGEVETYLDIIVHWNKRCNVMNRPGGPMATAVRAVYFLRRPNMRRPVLHTFEPTVKARRA